MGLESRRGDPVKRLLVLIAFLICGLGLVALSTGCKPPQTIIVPAPAPARIQRPPLRIKSVPATITTDDLLRAYVLDLAEQVGYADQLETLIWGPPTPKAP